MTQLTQQITDEFAAAQKAFNRLLARMWHRALRQRHSLSLWLAEINLATAAARSLRDRALLEQITLTLNSGARRPADRVITRGSHSLAILLPNTDIPGANLLAQDLLTKVQHLLLADPDKEVVERVTLSMGGATLMPAPQENLEKLLDLASLALSEARIGHESRAVHHAAILHHDCETL